MPIARSVTLPVRCANCGGTDSLALIGVIVAAGALVVALIALYISAREHVQFVKQLKARARFEITLDLAGQPGDELEIAADSAMLTFRIGLRNVGDRAAGETIVNVLVPASFSFLAWTTPSGMETGEGEALPTVEAFGGEDEIPATWIVRKTARVAVRTPVLTWFRVQVRVPTELPVKVVAQCDELPDDVEEVVCARTFRIRRKTADAS